MQTLGQCRHIERTTALLHRGPCCRALFAIAALLLTGCHRDAPVVTGGAPAAPAPTPPPAHGSRLAFTDRTPDTGIEFTYRNGTDARRYTILESIGGGIGIVDYDRDGWPDVSAAGGGEFGAGSALQGLPLGLFRNRGEWEFADVSAPARVRDPRYYTHGLCCADYDNDGFPDLLVTGYGGLQLWHNLGDGSFEEVAATAALTDSLWSTSAAWADLNGDGNLDLYVAHYVNWSFDNDPACPGPPPDHRDICAPRRFEGLDDVVYLSRGDGSFADATRAAGLVPGGKGLGVVCADLDLDGDVDVYVANDTTENFLYLNDGHGQLSESGLAAGVAYDDLAVATGSMGVDVCDFDRNGLPDLWVANFESEAFGLYRNLGHGRFLYSSRETGVAAINHAYVGFGTKSADFDNDGDEDMLASNGHVILFPKHAAVRQPPLLLENQGGRFVPADLTQCSYFAQPHHGRGLAVGDLDNDGDLDVVLSHNNEPIAFLENNTPRDPVRWLELEIVGRKSNRDGIGTRAVVQTAAGMFVRFRMGGGSYLSTSDSRLQWGLGPERADVKMQVNWPLGGATTVPFSGPGKLRNVCE